MRILAIILLLFSFTAQAQTKVTLRAGITDTASLSNRINGKIDKIDYRAGSVIDTLYYTVNGDTTNWYYVIVRDGLLNGGVVTYAGYDRAYYVSAAFYRINGQFYTTNDTIVILPALADVDSSRSDVFVVNTSGQATSIQGTESGNPLTPQVDPSSQIYLTHVTLSPTNQAAGVDTVMIYDEAAVSEWPNRSGTGLTVNFLSTSQPYRGTYTTETTTINNVDVIGYGTNTLCNRQDYDALSLFIKLKATMPSNNNIFASFWNDGVQVTNELPFTIAKGNVFSYQGVSFGLSAFAWSNNFFDSVRFRYSGGGILGIRLDFIYLQKGMEVQPPSANYVQNVRRRAGTDTVEQLINGQWLYAFKDSSGGAGLNFANADLTATGNRTHTFGDNYLYITHNNSSLYSDKGYFGSELKATDDLAYSSGLFNEITDTTKQNVYGAVYNGGVSAGFRAIYQGQKYKAGLWGDSIYLAKSYQTLQSTFTEDTLYYRPSTTSTAKYKAVLMDSTTGALVTTSPGNLGGVSPTRNLTISGGVGIDVTGGTQDLSADRTWTVDADTLLMSTRAWRQKGIDSLAALIGASGVTSLSAIGSSPNANGATISGNTLTLQPASASFGGVVTTGTQTFVGAKTFSPGFAGGATTINGLASTGANNSLVVGGGEGMSLSTAAAFNGTNQDIIRFAGAMGNSSGGSKSYFNIYPDLSGASPATVLRLSPKNGTSGTAYLIDAGTNTATTGSQSTHTSVFNVTPSGGVTINSTTAGFLPPRMTGAQAEAISTPAEGLMVYATDGSGTTITTKGWWGYDGTNWVKLN